MTKADAEITGVCPDCKYLYTERIHPFPSDSLPCCPKCGSKRRPYPVGAAGLPSPPDLIPITPHAAFMAGKVNLLLVLHKRGGYALGCWLTPPPTALDLDQDDEPHRKFATGSQGDGRGTLLIYREEIEAAWEVGDRPGHHE